MNNIIKTYWPNGMLMWEKSIGTTDDGRKLYNGKSIKYDDKGKEIGRYEMIFGTGTLLDWNENGTVISSFEMLEGKLNGLQAIYDEDGNLVVKRFWGDAKNSIRKGI